MFLHIGGASDISINDIICVLDIENAEPDIVQDLMQKNQTKTVRIRLTAGQPTGKPSAEPDMSPARSLVITEDKLYLSPISALTLQKRIEQVTLIFSRKRIISEG